MTITTTVHVNGKYKAIIKRDDAPEIECHGNYEGSPNPGGSMNFSPGSGTFTISEKQVVDDEPKAVRNPDPGVNADSDAD